MPSLYSTGGGCPSPGPLFHNQTGGGRVFRGRFGGGYPSPGPLSHNQTGEGVRGMLEREGGYLKVEQRDWLDPET